MTAGIAAHTALNSAWITRALAGAAYTDVSIAEPWVTVNTEAGSVRIIIRDDDALLCFTSVVSVGHGALPVADGERGAALGLVQSNLVIARISRYTSDGEPLVRAEYDVPILAGLSRAQFVSMLRAFTADVAVARRCII